MKSFTPIFVAPVGYAIVSALLLIPPWNDWLKLQVWYLISWPASHIAARESLAVEILCGCIQYAALAALWVLFFGKPHHRD